MTTKAHSFDDTALAPHVIADSVALEVVRALDGTDEAGAKRAFDELADGKYRDLADHLAERAEGIYAANADFRKAMNGPGNSGRDTLYAFMRHWASGFVRKNYGEDAFRALPQGFANGQEPPVPTSFRP